MVLLPELIVNKQKKTIPLCQETITKNSPHSNIARICNALICNITFQFRGTVRNYQRGGGGVQILKFCKIEKLNSSLYISIKNCDHPNARNQKM